MRGRNAAVLLLWVAGSGCNAILGLNDLTVHEQSDSAAGVAGAAGLPDVACSGNRECSERLTPAGTAAQLTPAVCLQSERRCVQLTSEDCTTVTGDYTDDSAIVIASLFSTTGAQATTNLHRQQAAIMAALEINAAGGIPTGPTSAGGRPLVMLSCDEAADLPRVAAHLIHDLRVPAIVGPNTSQDTLDLSRMFSIEAGTLLISPTAVASSIEDLLDRDLTWLLVPSDVQRAPLMLDQINALERQLSEERGRRPLKLGVIYRDDALGIGTRVSLNELEFNAKALGDPSNLGSQVRMDGYDFARSEQNALVDAYSAFAPDIVVLAGTAESITQIMLPL
jgi:branched-chain amino acid transport system substrate-binding protein